MVSSTHQRFSIKLQSFRAFRDEVSLDVRPLTLLYGFNQAGKSTLVRMLALVADSLQPGAGPLDLQSPGLRGASYKETCWLGRGDMNLSPWLTLTAPAVPPAVPNDPTFKIQFSDENGLVVNRLHLTPGEGGDKFKVYSACDVLRSGNEIDAIYEGTYRGKAWSERLNFRSLFPEGLPEQAQTLANQVREALAPLQRLQWLHANRLAGDPSTRPLRCCRPDGSDLAALLNNPAGRGILEHASSWLASQEGLGNELVVRNDSSGRPELLHGSPGREQLPLRLVGEGLRSLLPILLCALWAESHEPSAPTMLAVEEPEAHLHPTTQVALFDRLIDTIATGAPVVLETHSVYLLRAMQLAILDGRLSPDQVGLYWIGQGNDGASTVTNIDIKQDATLTDWRPDVFEKEQELSHHILDLRWNRQDTQ